MPAKKTKKKTIKTTTNVNTKKKIEKSSHKEDVHKGKAVAVLSYITIIGWVIAYAIHNQKKTDFGAYHLRQGLFIALAHFFIIGVGQIRGFPFSVLFGFALFVLGIGLFIIWLISLIAAAEGKKNEMPIIGHLAHEWFKGL